jgi:prevent-host-death family protein
MLPDQRRKCAVAQKSYFVLNGRMDRHRESAMKTMSAREAKNGFGLMIDMARAAPVLIEKHGRGVVVVMAVEEYERLTDSLIADQPGAADRRIT